MAISLAEVAGLLCCPDDGGRLSLASGDLQCMACDRRFRVYEQNLIEILPRRRQELPSSISSEYREGYERAFDQKYQNNDESMAWGAEESMTRSWTLKRRRQVEFVRPLVTEGANPGDSTLCDIAAGAGYYTLAYAQLFRLVLHCDLSVNDLSYARRKAQSMGIWNVLFVRADYFAPPFRNSLDRVLCMDTLIRGAAHESLLLASIAKSLNGDGFALVDFHNWWHNPLRRLGVLRNNFEGNRSYTERELNNLLARGHIVRSGFFPFVQELKGNGAPRKVFRKILPATRFVLRIQGTAEVGRSGCGE
jgi:ubiquinone/menaquinone biosynthesis C-methylase UbiE